jgi:hypothetical protein
MPNRYTGPTPVEDRFWSKVRKTDDCWTWTAAVQGNGYGVFSMPTGHGKGRVERAHRVAWELSYGPIPEGMDVCHRCDNPPCVRPKHLFLGSWDENMADARRKGRTERWQVKLSPVQVQEIRVRHGVLGETGASLARRFGVSPALVSMIVNEKRRISD